MIDINKEAEEYANNWEDITGLDPENTSPFECSKIDFIAGHNSKATQAKVIQAQIDLCNSALSWSNEIDSTSDYIEKELNSLQQKLKELENETD